jgi:hypothetical protein
VKRSEKGLLHVFGCLALAWIIVAAGTWYARRHTESLEARQREVFRSEIESRTPSKTPPVLAMEGTVAGRKFELIMRGFTNYFLKETWGAERGQYSFWGGQQPGGYKVTIRTKNFSGEWQNGWSGTHGGGGGGGIDEYSDDLLPGRWLWNRNRFVGATSDYDVHRKAISYDWTVRQWQEEYSRCKPSDNVLVPTQISWRVNGRSSGQEWGKDSGVDVVYKVRAFRFTNEPSEAWFAEQVKKYFPDSAHFKVTNSPPTLKNTNAP